MELVDGLVPVWPINKAGRHGRWQVGREMMQSLIGSGDIVLGKFNKKSKTWTVNRRVLRKEFKRLKTVWRHKSHDAGTYGTVLLNSIFGSERVFPFPKSIYAVMDCLAPIVRDRKDALIVDFFAGSGTTYHATALLNSKDQGNRRCILVTNNEVNDKIAQKLNEADHWQGDAVFEKHGIAEAVAWPRCKYVTTGRRDSGVPLPGTYLDGTSLSQGFRENIEYFRLDFVDPDDVARGEAFKAILPILWMMASAVGQREDSKGSGACFIPKHSPFAVLIKEKTFRELKEKLRERPDIKMVFLVTDSEENFGLMRRALGARYTCLQLYKNYLENFRLNTPEFLHT
jgi:adenine-specific DNA-methyltransferase